jgi:octanoyl-[GcvH]:protein N-octanoyltransferase
MGVGQRVISGAAHVGGVVVVGDSGRVRDVLIPVYDALGFIWDPATAGSLEDEAPGVTWEDAERAIVDQFSERFDLEDGTLSEETLTLAQDLAPNFVA